MYNRIFFLFAALYAHSVCGSHYSGVSESHGYGGQYGYGGYGYGHGGNNYGGHGDFRYHGPIAIPHVLHNGYIADTHEVAAAKAKHLAAVAQARAYTGYGSAYGYGGGYGYGGNYGYNQGDNHASSYGGHGGHKYHGPIAIPHVLSNGYIADTHEVAAAKAKHLTAVAQARAHGSYGHDYIGRYAGGYSGSHYGYSHQNVPYHGPLANPVVLKSGYLADTHEVAAAKYHHLDALHNAHLHSDGHYNYHY